MERRLKAIFLLLAIFASTSTDATAQQIVEFRGNCTFTLNDTEIKRCDPIMTYVNYNTLGIEFIFFVKDRAFVFLGSGDRQPNIENYYLSINEMKFGPPRRLDSRKVEGECRMKFNRNLKTPIFVDCLSFSRASGEKFHFKLRNVIR